MAASDDFYFTDIVALSTQGLMVVATMISLPAAVYFFLGAMVGAEQIASAITAAAFAASCAWMFAVAGAVRAVIYIARRSESGFQK
ncbi:MAG TPA: hypothetical protein VNQ76_14845 [Planctomicrobium sp.]|nr:hypothetical protein [Planctomicrobium sp.]